MNIIESLNETVAYLKQNGVDKTYEVGIVMGSGLEAIASLMEIEKTIPYTDIPNFPMSTVSFHKGNLLVGSLGGKKIIAMQGRFHFYEGYSMQQITFPIRVMKALGVHTLLLSNAAGGLNLNFKKGALVIIDDHINLLPDNPLRSLSDPLLGERFVDMSAPYNHTLKEKFIKIAAEKNIEIPHGVYVAVMGPNLETRAEYRWLRNMGADMVGMSTVPEVIVANQVGLQCMAVSVITDECDPNNLKPVNIAEIIEVAGKADLILSGLFESLIASI
jgi:purine-nucleoside phosphorylase